MKKPTIELSKEFMYEEYVVKSKTAKQIQIELGLKTIHPIINYVKKYNLFRGRIKKSASLMTKDFYIKEYIENQKSGHQISKELSCDEAAVYRMLKKYNIEVRPYGQITKNKILGWDKLKTGCGEITGRFWSSIRNSAVSRKLDFNISVNEAWDIFIKQNRKCAYTGLSLCFYPKYKKGAEQTASLDRIDSSKGYYIDNIQWVHKITQRMKWHLSEEQFLEFCLLIVNNRKIK
jgi:hypothetical protein